jgi:hypothetical protein
MDVLLSHRLVDVPSTPDYFGRHFELHVVRKYYLVQQWLFLMTFTTQIWLYLVHWVVHRISLYVEFYHSEVVTVFINVQT